MRRLVIRLTRLPRYVTAAIAVAALWSDFLLTAVGHPLAAVLAGAVGAALFLIAVPFRRTGVIPARRE